MRRIQVHVEEDLDDALARQALERGVPKAALIREYLAQHVKERRRDRNDPSAQLIGLYDGTANESANIDDVVYGSAIR